MEPNSDSTLWRNDESLLFLEQRLAQQPRTIEVVSFDFFDTLVSRLCADPPDVFVEVGRRLLARSLLRRRLTPGEFKYARMAADERARKKAVSEGKSIEVGLADIYAGFDRVVTDPTTAMEVEWDVERAFCYLNPSIASLVAFVRQLGYKTAVISDTYFSAKQLRILLLDNGLDPDLFDGFFVSSESGCAKWNGGGLYRKAVAHFDIHPNELLHIGDNPHVDIEAAAQLGIEAVHYYRTKASHDWIFQSERNLRGSPGAGAAALNTMRVLASRFSKGQNDAYRDGAVVFGPVLARFADWCAARFATAGVTTVLALMREGELLGGLLQRAAKAAGLHLKVVPCYVSRLSTGCAALEGVTVEQLDSLLKSPQALTLETIFDILGITDAGRGLVPQETLRKQFNSMEAIHGINQLLVNSPAINSLIRERCAQQHSLAFDYLSSLIQGEATFGVLDLGWSGTIQRNISKILRKGGRDIRIIGCYLATTPHAARIHLDGDEAYSYIELPRSPILPEVAITSCVGSTNGYMRTAEGVVLPVLGPCSVPKSEVELKGRFRDGIEAFQELWLHFRACKGAQGFGDSLVADIDAQSNSLFQRLLEYPTKPEADRMGELHHEENFWGVKHSRALCDWVAEDKLEQKGIAQLFHESACYWPQGVVARQSPRTISVLAHGWSRPAALGRMGVRVSPEGTPSGVTDEELASLLELLRVLNPQQVVYCASSGCAAEAILKELHRLAATMPDTVGYATAEEGSGQSPTANPPVPEFHWSHSLAVMPRLVVAGAADTDEALIQTARDVAYIAGDLSALGTLRQLRDLLQPCRRVLLVLTDSLQRAEIQAILNYVAPFLGPDGVIAANHGRFDSADLIADQPLSAILDGWRTKQGAGLRYQFWPDTHLFQQPTYNWTVLSRYSNDGKPDGYWTITLSRLAEPAPSERLAQPL